MSYATTEIRKYRIAIFPQEGTPAKISLWNAESQKFADTAKEVVEQVRELGPNRTFRALSPTRDEEPVYF